MSQRPPDGGGGRDRGPAKARFLDLEPSLMLAGAAEKASRKALEELLVDAAKARLRERWGDRIDGLAAAAVDKYLSEMESSLDVERVLARQARASREHEAAVARLFADDKDDSQ